MIRNFIFTLCILLSSSYSFAQESTQDCAMVPFRVALEDNSKSVTNIRNNPKGEIVLQLDGYRDYFTLNVIEFKAGWLKVNIIESVNFSYSITDLEGWIHASLVTVSSRRLLKLKAEPFSEKVVGTVPQETYGFKLIDFCENWVKIDHKGTIGWIENEWLCGNPVTTCP